MKTSSLQIITKHPMVFITSLVILILLIWGFWPKPVLVETTQVIKAPLTVSIVEDGKTRVIDRYLISSPVNGMTCRMHLKVGQPVEKGKALLSISPLPPAVLDARARATAEKKVASAKAALRAAQQQADAVSANTKQAEIELKRYQPLLAKGLISQDAYDKASTLVDTSRANQRSARFQVEVAQHELEAALTTLKYSDGMEDEFNSAELEHVIINSPIDGKILKVNRQCDGPVTIGESLLEVGNPNALEVEVDVLSADAVKIKPGMAVHFKRWGGDKTLEGRVRLVEPVGFTKVSALGVEEQRVWVIVDFTSPLDLWQKLGDGYRVEAEFILWQEDDVVQIKSSALFRYQEKWAVFKVDSGQAKLQTVNLGKRTGLSAQVLSGLELGTEVIDHPNEQIEDGRKIKIKSN